MIKSLKTLLIASAFTGLALAGAASAKDIKIGIMVPLSGPLASGGLDTENAIKLAIADANEKGGVNGKKIVTTTADDACDPNQAITAASKLVSENVDVVLGGYCSGSSLPTLKIYGDAKIPYVMIGANSSKLVTANPGNSFMINSTADKQADTALGLFKKLNVTKLAVIDEGDAYSADLAKMTSAEFQKQGGSVVSDETTTTGEQDFSAVVTKIKSSGAEAVFWTAYHAGGALLTKQLRQAGYKGYIVLADGSNTPEYLEIAGRAAEGVYLMSPPTLEFLAGAGDFKDRYKEAYGREAGAYAALSYDGSGLVLDALARATEGDPDSLVNALKASDYPGMAGQIRFTDKNTLEGSNYHVVVAKDGKWTLAD